MTEKYYVTTPIYYVNDIPHIGHSYTTIAGDVLARFFRWQGRDVRFLTGTDEHGIKIVKAAAEKNTTPQGLADDVVVHFEQLWKDLNISNDDFIRTTEDRHEKRVQEIIRQLLEKDEIYLGSYEGWYDEGQEEYVTESTARDNEYKSEINGKSLVRYSEDNYFFRLKKWVPKLLEYIEANPTFIMPESRRNEVVSKLKQGVEDLCISRATEKLGNWGIPMPNDPTHSVYVWIDALSNYSTALGWPAIGAEDDLKYDSYWPAIHLIGKDILWFHAVYWPCVLMAMGRELPKCVFAHGWWTSEGQKMSKSLGNFVSRDQISEICEDYSRDVYRYFLLRAVSFGADGDFSHDALKLRYNTELANSIGNLLSRTVNMIGKYFDGSVPACGEVGSEEQLVIDAAEELRKNAVGQMEVCAFHHYIDNILNLTTVTNRYIDVTAPFKLAKDESQREKLGTILYTCAEAVRIILLSLRPIMPEAAVKGLELLSVTDFSQTLTDSTAWGQLSPGTTVTKSEPLFPRKQD